MGQNPAKQIFEVPSFWQDFVLCISEKMCKGLDGMLTQRKICCFHIAGTRANKDFKISRFGHKL